MDTAPDPSSARPTPAWRSPRAVDVYVLLGLGLITLLGAASGGQPLLALAMLLPMWWRRTRPEASFAVVVLVHLVQLGLTDTPLASNVVAPFSAYAVAAHSTRPRWRWAGLAVALLSGVLGTVDWWDATMGLAPQVTNGIFLSAVGSLAWAWGDLNRRRRLLLERLQEQNAALRRDRDQRAALAAQDERTRIAREMHDVVAHSLAVVVVQADGAAYTARHAPTWDRQQAEQTLATIAQTARAALAETRQLVGVLRATTPGRPDRSDGYAPTETLADLGPVVDRVRASGVTVRLEADADVVDDPSSVPRDIGLAALRIVQESLTNVLKHAGSGAAASVSIRRTHGDEDALRVIVEDDGAGAAARATARSGAPATDDGHGNGILGMRERAAALGGSLTAGPRAGGGWRVAALLPVRRDTLGP